jgi:hypothetical protein
LFLTTGVYWLIEADGSDKTRDRGKLDDQCLSPLSLEGRSGLSGYMDSV